MAALDQIAVLKVHRPDALAVNHGPVGASHVHKTAMGRIGLDHKVDPGEVTIFLWQAEMGAAGPPNDEVVVAVKAEPPPAVRPLNDL